MANDTSEEARRKAREEVAEMWLAHLNRTHRAGLPPDFPVIVCLCGSTRFMGAFQKAEFDETLAGRIVLTIGCDTKSDGELFKGPGGEAIKARLDTLHLRKIDLADEVLILNVGGYVGESTRRELEYARRRGKFVRFLEPEQS